MWTLPGRGSPFPISLIFLALLAWEVLVRRNALRPGVWSLLPPLVIWAYLDYRRFILRDMDGASPWLGWFSLVFLIPYLFYRYKRYVEENSRWP